MAERFTNRQEAEEIEQFGDDLLKLSRHLDWIADRMSAGAIDAINAIPNQEHLDAIAKGFQALGAGLSRLCDAADERADRDRMVSVGGHRDGGSAS